MKICGMCSEDLEQVRLKYPIRILKTLSDIEELRLCLFCMIEHCTSVNCFGCRYGEYPNCQFLEMKKYCMKAQ